MGEIDATSLMSYLVEYENLRCNRKIVFYVDDVRERLIREDGVISVVAHDCDGVRSWISIPYREDFIRFESSFVELEGERIEYNGVVLAYVRGNELLIRFNPQDLADVVDSRIFNEIMGNVLSDGIDALLSRVKDDEEVDFKRWLRCREIGRQTKIKDAERKIEEIRYEIDDLRSKLWEEHKKLRDYRELIEFRKGFTDRAWRRRAEQEYQDIKKLCPQIYEEIKFSDYEIEAVTPYLRISYDGCSYPLGRIKITLDLENGQITFKNLDHRLSGDYDHPHIQEGKACWGNLEEPVARLLIQEDIYGLLVMASEFLRSYTPGNAFLKIQHWDPDYEEEDEEAGRYQSCADQASPRECVGCGDSGCPYYDGAEARCRENVDYPLECAECDVRGCSYHSPALEECKQARKDDPRYCIRCASPDCDYAGNFEKCFEIHKGALCESCQINECNYRLKTGGMRA